jgi:hypothetical protein
VAPSGELGDRLLELGLVARDERHARVALGGKKLRDCEADPVAPSGDQDVRHDLPVTRRGT